MAHVIPDPRFTPVTLPDYSSHVTEMVSRRKESLVLLGTKNSPCSSILFDAIEKELQRGTHVSVYSTHNRRIEGIRKLFYTKFPAAETDGSYAGSLTWKTTNTDLSLREPPALPPSSPISASEDPRLIVFDDPFFSIRYPNIKPLMKPLFDSGIRMWHVFVPMWDDLPRFIKEVYPSHFPTLHRLEIIHLHDFPLLADPKNMHYVDYRIGHDFMIENLEAFLNLYEHRKFKGAYLPDELRVCRDHYGTPQVETTPEGVRALFDSLGIEPLFP